MKIKSKKWLFLNTVFLLPAALPLMSVSCTKDRPTISLSSEAEKSLSENGYHLKGSAADFNAFNYSVSNPIDPEDDLYLLQKDTYKQNGKTEYFRRNGKPILYKVDPFNSNLYARDSFGNFIEDPNGKPLPIYKTNASDKVHQFKLKDQFKFLKLGNTLGNYDYRVFSFTWDELTTNFPGTKLDERYKKYANQKNVLFFILYYVTRTNELALNFVNDYVKPTVASMTQRYFDKYHKVLNISSNLYDNIQEKPWPYYKGIIGKDQYWKNAADPVAVVFEKP
ncbi:hypothetical protein [Mycoplasma struthionis]|uniref:Lipoprotein n=1 Tax=Mycoplasma struthionis TaxID=538220 RepID=A0A3G8LGI4_9MOLU|nr:hypothetical protein [Mycoplasma struthionis]AZG68504.1 hypothetical protein EGN60_00750 [Mycoplasma struthionis]